MITIEILINCIKVILRNALKDWLLKVWYFSQKVISSKIKQIKILTPIVANDEPQIIAFS